MNIIGANLGQTRDGTNLWEGGAALINESGIVTAIAEERITKKKYAGGCCNSIEYILEANQMILNDVDALVVSSCCDVPPTVSFATEQFKQAGMNISKGKIVVNPSHHMAHAALYFLSPFDQAIIFVADNDGNVLESVQKEYWANSIERTSYYIARGNDIQFISRDAEKPGDLGLGNTYQYFTEWIGYPNYQFANRVMGLAAYGDPERFQKVKLFDFNRDGQIVSLLEPIRDKHLSVRRLFYKQTGKDIGVNTPDSTKNPTQTQMDVARLLQKELERAAIMRIRNLVRKTGIKNLVVSGGVGLNCVMNGKLLHETSIEDIFIPPAAGDTGQCVGNALWAAFGIFGFHDSTSFTMNHAYLGKAYRDSEILKALSSFSQKVKFKKYKRNDLLEHIANRLSNGNIVCWFQGRSEFGPRALGNRSILADPRNGDLKDLLNKQVKQREWWRPFCPSILAEHVLDFINLSSSPFMTIATEVKPLKGYIIPAAMHIDNTTRVQTVARNQNPLYYDLIKTFYQKTGVPAVLNTSFNGNGQPIVETPEDALKSYMDMAGDILVIGNYIVAKQ